MLTFALRLLLLRKACTRRESDRKYSQEVPPFESFHARLRIAPSLVAGAQVAFPYLRVQLSPSQSLRYHSNVDTNNYVATYSQVSFHIPNQIRVLPIL